MKIFEKLRIIEAGETKNVIEENGKDYKLVISAESFPSLVALGNERPIHARRTHNGTDLLDGYIGYFKNFTSDDTAVYADLVMSEALETACPSEFAFMVSMIEKEPELLGVSVNQMDVKKFDDETGTATVTEVTAFFSADLVGLPAATSSLFSNNFKNSKTMSKFSFKGLVSMLSKTKLATETFTTSDGTEITVSSASDEVQVGDAVTLADGSPAPDGDYQITTPDGDIILVVEGGVIAGVKDIEVEEPEELAKDTEKPEDKEDKEDKEEKKTPTPEELATVQAEVTALRAEISALKTQLNRKSGTPKPAKTEVKTEENKGETKLSREAVQKAFLENRKKWR
nr:MAG: Prohead core protein serine protease [Bacteriophage sp.]